MTTEGLRGLKTIPCNVRGAGFGGSGWAAIALVLRPATDGGATLVLEAIPATSADEPGLGGTACPGAPTVLAAPGANAFAAAALGLELIGAADLTARVVACGWASTAGLACGEGAA